MIKQGLWNGKLKRQQNLKNLVAAVSLTATATAYGTNTLMLNPSQTTIQDIYWSTADRARNPGWIEDRASELTRQEFAGQNGAYMRDDYKNYKKNMLAVLLAGYKNKLTEEAQQALELLSGSDVDPNRIQQKFERAFKSSGTVTIRLEGKSYSIPEMYWNELLSLAALPLVIEKLEAKHGKGTRLREVHTLSTEVHYENVLGENDESAQYLFKWNNMARTTALLENEPKTNVLLAEAQVQQEFVEPVRPKPENSILQLWRLLKDRAQKDINLLRGLETELPALEQSTEENIEEVYQEAVLGEYAAGEDQTETERKEQFIDGWNEKTDSKFLSRFEKFQKNLSWGNKRAIMRVQRVFNTSPFLFTVMQFLQNPVTDMIAFKTKHGGSSQQSKLAYSFLQATQPGNKVQKEIPGTHFSFAGHRGQLNVLTATKSLDKKASSSSEEQAFRLAFLQSMVDWENLDKDSEYAQWVQKAVELIEFMRADSVVGVDEVDGEVLVVEKGTGSKDVDIFADDMYRLTGNMNWARSMERLKERMSFYIK